MSCIMSYKSQDEQYLTFLTVAVPLLSSVEGKCKRRKCHEQPELPSRSATSVWPNVHSSRIRDTWEFFSVTFSPQMTCWLSTLDFIFIYQGLEIL